MVNRGPPTCRIIPDVVNNHGDHKSSKDPATWDPPSIHGLDLYLIKWRARSQLRIQVGPDPNYVSKSWGYSILQVFDTCSFMAPRQWKLVIPPIFPNGILRVPQVSTPSPWIPLKTLKNPITCGVFCSNSPGFTSMKSRGGGKFNVEIFTEGFR